MKIFFLEERLANGNQNSNVDLINANAELKVIKYLNCSLQIDFWTLLREAFIKKKKKCDIFHIRV